MSGSAKTWLFCSGHEFESCKPHAPPLDPAQPKKGRLRPGPRAGLSVIHISYLFTLLIYLTT